MFTLFTLLAYLNLNYTPHYSRTRFVARRTARPRGGIRTGAPLDDQSMAQLDELLVPPAGATLPSTNEMEQEGNEFFK